MTPGDEAIAKAIEISIVFLGKEAAVRLNRRPEYFCVLRYLRLCY